MAYKKLLFRSEAREALLKGTGALADAVRITLRPRSKSVFIQKSFGAPIICDDGVTIAEEFRHKEREENMGTQLLRQAAERTGDAVGDGTTTSTIIANALFSEGVRNVAAGASGLEIRRGFEDALYAAVAALRGLSRPVQSRKKKSQVASISAHGDQTIGELMAEAMEKVGDDGAIMVDESRTTETVLEDVEGLQFDRGHISPYFVTDSEALTARLEDTAILLQIEDSTSNYDREKLNERLAKLSGDVAVIRAGAATEAELRSRKEALDDAINATKAAVEEGIVPGGGLALVRVIEAVETVAQEKEGDRRRGVLCLARALGAPARKIAENSAMDGGVVLAEMKKVSGAWGFDTVRNIYTDVLEAGILDPTKVVRIALENAKSVAGTLLLTEAAMVEIPEDEDKPARQALDIYA